MVNRVFTEIREDDDKLDVWCDTTWQEINGRIDKEYKYGIKSVSHVVRKVMMT